MKYRVKSKKGMDRFIEAPPNATPEQLDEAIRDQIDQQVWDDLGIKQQLQEMEPIKREIRAEDKARAQSVRVLDESIGKMEKKKSEAESMTLEKEIQRLKTIEDDFGRRSAGEKDPKAWNKLNDQWDSISKRRVELMDKLKKVNPARHEELSNEFLGIKK